MTMDNSKQTADVDDHNTNQNEAACIAGSHLMTDQFQDPRSLPEASSSPDQNLDVNIEVKVKSESNVYSHIPSIIVTPSSPITTSHNSSLVEEVKYDPFNSKKFEQSSSSPVVGSVQGNRVQGAIDLLNIPSSDMTLNIKRPSGCVTEVVSPGVGLNLSIPSSTSSADMTRGMDISNDEDIEVMCRYSSTPVLTNVRNGPQNFNDTDCNMSINDASPIAPDDSSVCTSSRSNHPSVSQREQHGEDKGSNCNENQNIMYVHPQYLLHAASQTMLRRDMTSSQSTQAPFVGGRIVNQSYPPSSSFSTPGAYCNTQNVYPTYMQGCGPYSDYFPTSEISWTDINYPSDTSSPVPPLAGTLGESCCYQTPGAGSSETEYFVYPSIYVSSSGLISVLLRNDMSVEMTVDRTIRVVSHNHMMAVATDSRGTAACLYHPAVKVFQIGTTTDIATPNFRARMGGGEAIVFSNGVNFFKLEDSELQPTAPIKFTDIFRDQSVNLLFSSEGYGESLVASCMQVAAQAEYANLPKGGVIVRINGVKVTQTGSGDVTVVTGAKFIRLSPHFGTTRLGNRFVDIEVEKDWTVKLTRGSHSFVYSKKRAMVCNGKMEAGFDENNGLKVTNLQLRLPLLAEPSIVRRPCRKPVRVPSSSNTPKRRLGPTGTGRGGGTA